MRVKVVVFEFCLQRPKYVIFEGLSEEGLVMVMENDEEEEENCREKLESLRTRERMRRHKMKMDVCMCYCGHSLHVGGGRYFCFILC